MKTTTFSFFAFLAISITPLKSQTVTDIDGNVYQTVTIGSQTWMKENLRVTHFRNGDALETTKPLTLEICNAEKPVYQWACNYKDSLTAKFGRVYTWYAAADSRKVCPVGWHVPDNNEWLALRKNLGVDTVKWTRANEKEVKAIISKLTSVFYASVSDNYQAGVRSCGGIFDLMNCWWTSSDNQSRSKIWNVGPYIGDPLKTYKEENNGHSIRCIKD